MSKTSQTEIPSPVTTMENKQQVLQTSSLTIGILSQSSYYQELANYLRSQFGNKVQIVIDGDESISYEEARKRIINKEWDIAFTLSPMLSVAAKDNGYHFAARMFPNSSPYYQGALFVKSNSTIQSLNDLKVTNTIALGDFNSASSFYIPTYDLFGKSLRVDMGHKGTKIKELVNTGKADLGAAAYDTVKNDKDFKIIHLSKQIPGSNLYLSPKLSESDRATITKVLLDAPENIKKQANYGDGQEPDYSQLIKISQKAEDVLRCANFQKNPVNFFCSNNSSVQSFKTSNTANSEILGRINGWSRKDSQTENFNLSGKDNQVYQIVIPRKILNQVPGASNPIALQGKDIKIINVIPRITQGRILELKITQSNQLSLL
jgi:ABC-type phosphate/phosphonate transport system substrate-binding protein